MQHESPPLPTSKDVGAPPAPPEALPPFDPRELDAQWRRQRWRAYWRLLQLVGLLLTFVLDHWLETLSWLPSTGGPEARQRRHARRLRDRLLGMGPTFIKIGQLLSTRHDLLPLAYVRELESLQDQVPAFSPDVARAIVAEELGCDPLEAFAAFDPNPLSAASIGQVHRARLHSGEEVVVKIQRPGLAERFQLDLSVLRWLTTRIANSRYAAELPLLKNIDYLPVLDRFGADLYAQIDFVQEARNMERFRRNFAGFDGITAPKPYWELSTRRILTQEFIQGVKFNDYTAIAAMGVDFARIASLGVRSFIKQVLEDGFFHADTHPGNVLVKPNGDVAYIDFGMVDTFEPELTDAMAALFVHLLHEDFTAFVTDLIHLGLLPREVDYGLVTPIIEDIYHAQMGNKETRYTLSQVVERLGAVMFKYDFTMPEKFAFLMRAMSSMEGIVLQVDPHFKFLEVALPFAAKILLSDGQRSVRDRLIRELMPAGQLRLGRLVEILDQASREPSFQVGEFARVGIDYLLSDEARDLRCALTGAIAAEVAGLGGVARRIAADPSVDPWEVTEPLLRFLHSPEGAEWLEHLGPHMERLHDPQLFQAVETFVDRLFEQVGPERMLRELMPTAKLLLSDRAMELQPLVEALAKTLADPDAVAALDRGSRWIEKLSPASINDALFLLSLALDRGDLEINALLLAGGEYLARPEAEPWRQAFLEAMARSEHDGAILSLGQRILLRPDLRRGTLGALGPVLRFLLTQEANDTRQAIASMAFKRLASGWPFTSWIPAAYSASRYLPTEEPLHD
jgi:predicted unusual protein kinase regulating ubiquinone biosynthesis (AarF/ABC1/UbiB family)